MHQAKITSDVAKEIWSQHYNVFLTKHETNYIIDKFQNQNTIYTSIKNGTNYYWLLDNISDDILGYFAYEEKEDCIFLSKLYLYAAHRGNGYSNKVITFLDFIANKEHLKTIRLNANKKNPSIDIYKKMGFKIVESTENCIGNNIVMYDYILEREVNFENICTTSAIVLAAGNFTRMNDINKQFTRISNIPVIIHTLKAFENSNYIDETILVTREKDLLKMKSLIKQYNFKKVVKIIVGGKTRQDSVLNGIDYTNGKYIAIHDGARPFITAELIKKVVIDAWGFGSAILAVPTKDTMVVADVNNIVKSTPNRQELWNVQTPQVFLKQNYNKAVKIALEKRLNFTDDSQLMDLISERVSIVESTYTNLKITTPEDLIVAQLIYETSELE